MTILVVSGLQITITNTVGVFKNEDLLVVNGLQITITNTTWKKYLHEK